MVMGAYAVCRSNGENYREFLDSDGASLLPA